MLFFNVEFRVTLDAALTVAPVPMEVFTVQFG